MYMYMYNIVMRRSELNAGAWREKGRGEKRRGVIYGRQRGKVETRKERPDIGCLETGPFH